MGAMLQKQLLHMWVKWLLLLNLACALFMTGLIWFVQLVHYPLFGRVGAQNFVAYERAHQRLTTWVTAPVMLFEAALSIALVCIQPSSRGTWLALALTLLVWASTMLVQVPLHAALAQGFESASLARLVASNWIRTIIWSGRSILLLWLIGKTHG